MRPLSRSVNQRLPSGPTVIDAGLLVGGVSVAPRVPAGGGGSWNSVTTPRGVIRATWFAPGMVNQRLPSGPAAISCGPVLAGMPSGRGNSVSWPAGVIRPIFWPLISVNQRLPSGPVMIPLGPLLSSGRGNTVTFPAGVVRTMAAPEYVGSGKEP